MHAGVGAKSGIAADHRRHDRMTTISAPRLAALRTKSKEYCCKGTASFAEPKVGEWYGKYSTQEMCFATVSKPRRAMSALAMRSHHSAPGVEEPGCKCRNGYGESACASEERDRSANQGCACVVASLGLHPGLSPRSKTGAEIDPKNGSGNSERSYRLSRGGSLVERGDCRRISRQHIRRRRWQRRPRVCGRRQGHHIPPLHDVQSTLAARQPLTAVAAQLRCR